jgi:phosphoglycolate phosphatase-like HAD superfamily hydrolase
MNPNTLEQIIAHLQILGYEMARADRIITAKHRTKCNLILSQLGKAIQFTIIYGSNATAKRNRESYLEFLNTLKALRVIVWVDFDGFTGAAAYR